MRVRSQQNGFALLDQNINDVSNGGCLASAWHTQDQTIILRYMVQSDIIIARQHTCHVNRAYHLKLGQRLAAGLHSSAG